MLQDQFPPNVPRAGATFEYGLNSFRNGPATYRVNGWMRRKPHKIDALEMAMTGALPDEYGGTRALLVAELFSDWKRTEPASKEQVFEFCRPSVATHVCGSGIAGCIAPISEIVVTGMVAWSEEQLDEAHRSAMHFADTPH